MHIPQGLLKTSLLTTLVTSPVQQPEDRNLLAPREKSLLEVLGF